MLSLIVAIASDYAIGRKGTLPWHISDDLKHFKRITRGHTMLMGMNTFISLPGVLPKRKHIVIADDPTFNVDHPQVEVRRDLFSALEECKKADEEIFVIGGGSVYRQSLPFVDKLYITWIDMTVPDADTFFPQISDEEWQAVYESEPFYDEENAVSYRFVNYEHKHDEKSLSEQV